MKVNLLVNQPGDVRSGYLNIDPAAPADCQDGRVHGDLSKLSLVEANEATELVAHGILDRYSVQDADTVLDQWIGKLAHGGTLSISVVDIREVARAVLYGTILLEDANALLHAGKQCSLTMGRLVDVLQSKGLKIVRKHIQDYQAFVIAQRS